jgi:hypothetical protein
MRRFTSSNNSLHLVPDKSEVLLRRLRNKCQSIMETELVQLMNPSVCRSFISRLQALQKEWDIDAEVSPLAVLVIFSNVSRLVEHIEEDTWMWT